MKSVLSVQSHVCYGYVGNRAAVFPLQRLGFEVIAVNTVQFSNHTGYGDWGGESMSSEHIASILAGLERRGVFQTLDAVLSGYLGEATLAQQVAQTVRKIKSQSALLYCCDPVMGDQQGMFVKPEVAQMLQKDCLPLADILTPNLFELTYLSGKRIQTLSELLEACRILHSLGPKTILVTSTEVRETPPGKIQMVLSQENQRWLIETPKFELHPAPNGSGDFTAAVFLAHVLKSADFKTALELTAASVFAVFEENFRSGEREFQIIQVQDRWMQPLIQFEAISL